MSLLALKGETALSDYEAYAQSKLALTMWTFDLAKRVTDVAINAVNPGSLLNTNMVKEAFGGSGNSIEIGANVLFQLALYSEYQGKTGEYFDNDRGQFGLAHEDAYDASKIQSLLETTLSLIER